VGQPFVKMKKSRNMQKDSSMEDAKHWSLNETYSVSFAASSIDLTTWKVLCPFETNLSLFWGNHCSDSSFTKRAHGKTIMPITVTIIRLQITTCLHYR
jgi:uncharacterized protein (DUF1800 family)